MKLERRHSAVAGFTLIETLTALVVAGILMSIAIPRFFVLLPTIRVSSAARQVVTDLQLARMRAISQHSAQTVTFTPPTGAYSFGPDSRDLNQLYPGTKVSTMTGGNPTFSTVGVATSGDTTITLNNNGVTKQVQVTAIGRVKIP